MTPAQRNQLRGHLADRERKLEKAIREGRKGAAERHSAHVDFLTEILEEN